MKKKLFSILLCGVLALNVCGCGKDEEPKGNEGGNDQTKLPTTTPAEKKPVSVTEGVGSTVKVGEGSCRIDAFEATVEKSVIGSKVNYSYTISNVDSPVDYCAFNVDVYDKEGNLINSYPQYVMLKSGQSTDYTAFNLIMGQKDSEFTIKLSGLK